MSDTLLEIRHLKKHFGSLEVLKDIDFHCDSNEVITDVYKRQSLRYLDLLVRQMMLCQLLHMIM